MPAGRGNFQRALCVRLTFDVGKVWVIESNRSGGFRDVRQKGLPERKVRAHLEQRPGLVYARAPDQGRLVGARRRKHEDSAVARGPPGHGERAANRAQLSGQGKLSGEFVLRKPVGLQLARGGEDPQRDREIEAAAFLGKLGGREIDGDARRS